jgi:DNA-binding NarL/FixJ family response regulator
MSDEANAIRILVADDHPIIREGVAALVGGQPDMRVIGEASNGREAIQQFRAQHPDITLMDIQMPVMSGLDALIAIRDEAPEARIIMLTTYSGDAQVQRAIKAGARGYLLKSSLHEELLQTIRAVHAGRRAISAEASFELAEHATDDALTPAEVRVLRLIGQGSANKEIAEQRRDGQRPSPKHPVQIGRERPHPGCHDRGETRHHRVVIPSKESHGRPFWGLCLDSGVHNLIMSCVDFSQLSLTAGPEPAFSLCAWYLELH